MEIKDPTGIFPKSELESDMLLKFSNGDYFVVWIGINGKKTNYLVSPIDDYKHYFPSCPTWIPLQLLQDDLSMKRYDNNGKLRKTTCISIHGGSHCPGDIGLINTKFLRPPIWNRYRKIKTSII